MANNKDFKVKNGIQPTVYHEAVGTVTSGSEGYYLVGASYDSVSFSVASQDSTPFGTAFKTDGTKMYVTGFANDTVFQYALSTAWDVSTASYESKSFSFASQEANGVRNVNFKPDGTKMYLSGTSGDSIYQYSLSTAWDVNTAFYDSVSVSMQSTNTGSHTWASDGTKIYVTDTGTDFAYQYDLSTAWDLSTATYANKSLSLASQDTSPFGIAINDDGSKLFMSGITNDTVYQYSMSTAYDLSTASYDSISFSVVTQATAPYSITFGNSGTKMYITDGANDTVHQYSTALSLDTLNLSTGSVFEISPSNSVKINLSNPSDSGTVSAATLILEGTALTSYEIDGSSYDGVRFGVSNEEGSPSGIFFKPDGKKMYICGYTDDEVNEYDLSPPWDITSATPVNVFNLSGQETAPVGIAFKTDGTEMYMVGQAGDDVTQYTLSVAWDISSINPSSPVTASKALTGETTPEDIRFKPDGTKMYVCGSSTNAKISEYALSTAWDLSTATYTDTINISAQGAQPRSFDFSSDGTKVAVVDSGSDVVFQYDLSTAWDVSTATYNNVDVSTGVATPQGLIFKSNGEKMYIVDSSTVQIYQFNTSSTHTITYDSSIEWEGGSAPSSPNISDTDVITFTTRDGGTSYQAKQVMDGVQ